MRKHTGAFHGNQHFSIKWRFKKGFYQVAGFIILFIQNYIHLPVGIYFNIPNAAAPTAVAVKFIAYIGITAGQGKPDFIFPGFPWNKAEACIGSLYVHLLLL